MRRFRCHGYAAEMASRIVATSEASAFGERRVDPSKRTSAALRSGSAVPAHDSSNPGRLQPFDAKTVIRGLRRVILVAPSLAFLLVLAAAAAASATDGLDLVGAAAPVVPVVPSVDEKAKAAPIVSGLKPVKDRAVKTAIRALPDGSAQVAGSIVRGVKETVGSVTPAPVPIPPVLLPDLSKDPGRDVQPRGAHPQAVDQAEPTAQVPLEVTTSLAAESTSSLALISLHQADGNPLLRQLQPATTLGQFEPADAGVIGGSGTGPGPWLGHVTLSHAQPAWRSGAQPAIPFAIPRGLTPRPLVPPG